VGIFQGANKRRIADFMAITFKGSYDADLAKGTAGRPDADVLQDFPMQVL
jgi:hypothetical protein